MGRKKGSKNKSRNKPEKRTTILVTLLEEIKSETIDNVSNDRVKQEFIKRFMTPFDNIIEELEKKKEQIEDLKSEIEDLAN